MQDFKPLIGGGITSKELPPSFTKLWFSLFMLRCLIIETWRMAKISEVWEFRPFIGGFLQVKNDQHHS